MTQRPSPISCEHEIIYVRAKWDYTSEDPEFCVLKLRKGESIRVISKYESGWWDGLNASGTRGWFPSNYCEPCETPKELKGAILAKL